MLDENLLAAERCAEEATRLAAFPINLLDVRRNVDSILKEFGRHGFFSEFTVHDFSHCQEMIKLLDWIIPADSKKSMSGADWLMIVLACYFHDMGLLITRDEFEERQKSDFPRFCAEELFGGANGADYRQKVETLAPEEREKFLYQEFVRANHGPRVRSWIEGRPLNKLGVADAAFKEIQSILSKLPGSFKRDLGLVCESHNLDDLHDLKKYRLSQPYGNSDAETVNLQYSAVLLRTVDLMQITNHRAPSILYRLINPTDPISQREWAKQNAVTRVRPKVGLNREGNPDPSALTHTVEIFAEFTNEDGFFGLTSYLAYARDQLKKSNEVIEKSKRQSALPYGFPWRDIDDSRVEAQGFLKDTFGFELDQARILDLLTGHTLYNDSNVVVRELLQNSIDAVRLQALIEKKDSQEIGKVSVNWNSADRILEILDNGTGMTQEVIENHLLKVGSSRYQSQQFRDAFPSFSSISRFGIGVLSAFMVADTVEIVSASIDEPLARQISLRSVHGKYLIRLLEKEVEPTAIQIGPHGTLVRLKFRPSVENIDIASVVRHWVLFPACSVSVSIDGSAPASVGYKTPKDALEALIQNQPGRFPSHAGLEIKVIETELEGLKIAIALQWSKTFKDWNFARFIEREEFEKDTDTYPPICTCVEGIAVEFSTPGFRGTPIAAIANARGTKAPKTNVARSSIEDTTESRNLTRKIYQAYIGFIATETQRLRDEEKYSISWAAGQVPYLSFPLVSDRARVANRLLRREALEKLPMFLVEDRNQRIMASLADLRKSKIFWTIESELADSAERFVREAPTELTLRQLVEGYQKPTAPLPTGLLVCNVNQGVLPFKILQSHFEIVSLNVSLFDSRLDIEWAEKEKNSRWLSTQQMFTQFDRRSRSVIINRLADRSRNTPNILVPLEAVKLKGLDDFACLKAHVEFVVLPTQPVGKFLSKFAKKDPRQCYLYCLVAERLFVRENLEWTSSAGFIEKEIARFSDELEIEIDSAADFIESIRLSKTSVFDPHARSGRRFESAIII